MSGASTNLQTNFFFGWDLLYRTVEPKLNKKSDILIALAHFVLIKHSQFQCIGVGEDKTFSENDVGSELLPHGWNDDEKKYALRYIYNNKLYLLLAHKTGNSIITNLLDSQTKKVSNIVLDTDDLVRNTKGSINVLMPTASEIANRMLKELIEPVFTGTTREITTQTAASSSRPPRPDPLRISDHMHPRATFVPPGTDPLNPFGWPEVGRGDLDPLGRGGPGNLLPFPSAPEFNNQGRPRFDPYGVPESNTPAAPDPDHLRPPNFNGHDYYM